MLHSGKWSVSATGLTRPQGIRTDCDGKYWRTGSGVRLGRVRRGEEKGVVDSGETKLPADSQQLIAVKKCAPHKHASRLT